MAHKFFLTTALTLAGFAAHPLTAQSFESRVAEMLADEGFTTTQVEVGPTQTRFEAVRDGTRLEVTYDRATGRIVGQETERFEGTLPADLVAAVVNSQVDFEELENAMFEDDEDAFDEIFEDAVDLGLTEDQIEAIADRIENGEAVDIASLAAELGVDADELGELAEDYAEALEGEADEDGADDDDDGDEGDADDDDDDQDDEDDDAGDDGEDGDDTGD